jgi:hypothetical protein
MMFSTSLPKGFSEAIERPMVVRFSGRRHFEHFYHVGGTDQEDWYNGDGR